MDSYVFYRSGGYSARMLYVPSGSLAAYQADNNWSNYFGNIVEMVHNGDVSGDSYIDINDVTILISAVLTGDLTNIDFICADCDGNGIIDINDVTMLISHVLTGAWPN